MRRILAISLLLLLLPCLAAANTVDSGTLEFEGALTHDGDAYTGTIAATPGSWYVAGGGGAGVSEGGGFDVYAEEGGCAYVLNYYDTGAWNCDGDDTYVIGYNGYDAHDAYPHDGGGNLPWGDFYNPDCADWYNYQLRFEGGEWFLEYNANVGNDGILTGAAAAPMSGLVDWTNMYAAETGTGEYYDPKPAGYPFANTGNAAAFGAGPGYWDMDWSWGSDAIPLELAGFDIEIEDLTGGNYHVKLIPADPGEVWVDDDFTSATPGWGVTHFASIQDGIDAVSGSTVNVAAGTYAENIVVDKALALIGAGPTATLINPGGTAPVITVAADGVTLADIGITDATQLVEGIRVTASSGLTLSGIDFPNLGNNPGPGNAYGVNIQNDFTDLTVTDCRFIATNLGEYSRAIGIFAGNDFLLSNFDVSGSTFEYLFVGVYLRSDINGLAVTNNTFGPFEIEDCNAAASGVYIGDGSQGNFDVQNVSITLNEFTSYARGVYMWNYSHGDIIGQVDISQNTFTNSIWSAGIRFIGQLDNVTQVAYLEGPITVDGNTFVQNVDIGGSGGVSLIEFRSGGASPTSQIAVTDNDVTFAGPFASATHGVLFRGPITNATVSGNTLNGGGAGGTVGGLPETSGIIVATDDSWLGPLASTAVVNITGNTVTGFENGVAVYDRVAAAFGNLPVGAQLTVEDNDLSGNTLAFNSGDGETADASPNWWGDTYPRDDIAGPVEIYPCYADAAMTGLFPPDLVVDAGWSAFVIRENATEGAPYIWGNDNHVPDAVEFVIFASGQKAGLGTDDISGARIDMISTLHIDRLDDIGASGSEYGPYFNIWVTDGDGHYAVLANEPSDAEWAGSRWNVPDWDFLRTKRCKVYETVGAAGGQPGTSWVYDHTGIDSGLIFEDVADLIVEAPDAAYIADAGNGVGSGAPDELGTNAAYGFNWIFGDTSDNYVTGGGEGFVVDNYRATADFPVHNVTQDTWYGTIQAAIDAAAAGDAIEIAAGTYEEQVHITTSDITLTGAGSGDDPALDTIVLCPETLTWFYHTSLDNYPIIGFDGVTGVTVQDLRVDGAGRGNANYRFQGVGFWNSGGTLADAVVADVRDTPFSGAQHGVGVYAYNDTGGPYTVNLTNVDVPGYQKGGIALNGTGLTANVTNCETIGAGATDITAQNGIQMWGGAGGSISGCTVSGNIYTGSGWAGSGVLLIDAGTVTLSDTDVTDGDPCLYCDETSVVASGLELTNNAPESGNGFYVRIGDPPRLESEMDEELATSPFGDYAGTRGGGRATASVSIDDCVITGQTTGYGISASNYVAGDLIDITVTNTTLSNWGWGLVAFGSGGEVAVDAHGNNFSGNAGYFYAAAALTTTQDATGNYWGALDQATLDTGVFNGDIDYSPWLGDLPGTSPMNWYTNDSIQEAVDSAQAGDAVHVTEGTYVAPAQLVIDKNLTLSGAGRTLTTIEPGFDTTVGSYLISDALLYVDYGVTALIEDLAIDGTGHTVRHAIQSRGADLTVRSCDIRDIHAATYAGRGIVYLTGTGLVEDCAMSGIQRIGVHIRGSIEPAAPVVAVDGLVYTGKGTGDFLDYGVEFGGGGQGSVANSVITDCLGVASVDGSTSGAIMVTDYYGTGTTADIAGCTLTGNTTGLLVGYEEDDLSVVTITGSTIADNDEYGVSSTGPVVTALGNWWGDATGPQHPVANPAGLGNEVSDFVLFDPWFTGNVVVTPDPQTISLADAPDFEKTVVCEYLGGGSGGLYGYSIDVLYDDDIIDAVFAKPDNGPFASAALFMVTGITGGVRIDAGLGGDTPGITVGELFKATVIADSCGTTALALTLNNFRDSDNQPLTGFAGDDGEVQVDMVAPTAANGAITRTNLANNGHAKDGDDLVITTDFADACGGFAGLTFAADLSGLIEGGGTAVAPDATADPTVTWTLNAVDLTEPDGQKDVTLTAVDPLGNEVTTVVSIIADNTAPAAVADITAAPRHLQVEVGWTHDGADVDRYRVYRGMWYDTTPGVTAYPEYDDLAGDVIPTHPAAGLPDPGQGWVRADADDLAFDVDSFFDVFADLSPTIPRGVFYYEVYAVDLAGNVSTPADANDRATNYWLGDVSGDGLVNIGGDITPLSVSYGKPDGNEDYNNLCDVGPTDDSGPRGIPTTDNWVDFEDLMIFSMNYGMVAPRPVIQEDATESAAIAWRRIEETTWALVLEQPCVDLKGLNLSADLSAGAVLATRPGDLCEQQVGRVFVKNIDANGLDAGLALLGTGAHFIGAGELLRITFAADVAPGDIELVLRNSLNEPLDVEMDMTGVMDDLPTVYRMSQNFPNPFNPTTSISFDLPEAQTVRLSVFAPDGRCITHLVNAALPAGHHSVTWNGRDSSGQPVASGVYFYSIDAGPLRQTSKMLLLK